MVLERIRQAYPMLTKSQRRLADFVAESYREVALMTASKLGKRLSLNEATVIRFAQKLGYPGYPAFVADVRAIVRGEWGNAEGEDADQAGVEALLERRVQELARVVSHLPADTLRRAVAVLAGADNVIISAAGVVTPLAEQLCIGLRILGISSRTVSSDSAGLGLVLTALQGGDVLLAIVSDEPAPLLTRALALAGEHGAHTVALATSPVTPSARAAELALCCLPVTSDLISAIMPLALLIDLILELLAAADPEAQAARAQTLETWRVALVPGRGAQP